MPRRSATRRILIAASTLLTAGGLFLAAPRIEEFLRYRGAARIAIDAASVPFTTDITLAPGKAAVLILPHDKELAIWCERASRRLALPGDLPLALRYGERPYLVPEPERLPLPSGGTTFGELRSYIRQGSVMDRGAGLPGEFILFVDPYRISLDQQEVTSAGIRLVATVTRASEEELVSRRNEVDYFVGRLSRQDPAIRLDAARKLTESLMCGSTYAEPRRPYIIEQLRLRREDPEPKVREHVAASLRELGDAQEILRVMQPLPAGAFLNAEGARQLGTNTKECADDKERSTVCRHVLGFSGSDDPRLREFAVRFFSATDPVPEARALLVEARRDPSAAVRAASLHALDNLCDGNLHDEDPANDSEARDETIKMLGDPAQEVVIAALETSVYRGEERLLPYAAVRPFLSSSLKDVRLAAISAVRFDTDPDCRRTLLDFTREADPQVRAAAAEALYRAESTAIRDRMVELLGDTDPLVRIRALQALNGGNHADTAPAIRSLLERERDPDALRVARETLKAWSP